MLNQNSYNTDRRSCPLCEGNAEILFSQSFEEPNGAALINCYDVSKCVRCGMLFANNITSQRDFDDYYSNNNKYEIVDDVISSKLNSYHQTIFDYVSGFDKATKIADFGCGKGNLPTALHKNGFTNLYALDTSKQNCAALSKIGINTLQKSIFEIKKSDYPDKLDVIILVGVLEHVVDLHGFIQNIDAVLKDNGMFILCVPWLKTERGEKKPFQEFSIEHINYFDYVTLGILLKKHGYSSVMQLGDTTTLTVVYKRNLIFSVEEYIDISNKSVESSLKKVDIFIASQTAVIIWGAGTYTRYLLKNTRFAKLNIIAFVDNNIHYQGKTMADIPILSPDEIKRFTDIVPIIIVSYSAADEIIDEIKNDLKLTNEVVVI